MTRNHWPFLPLGRIYSSLLATLRAFWSLEPQAYLAKTYCISGKNMQQKLQFMTHKQIIWPHFAVSTCCTVLSSHGDDPSWIQYEEVFFLRCSYLLISAPNAPHFEPNLFQWQVPACLNRVSWKQDTDKETSCKVYVGKTWQDCLENENCTLARGKLGALKHPGFFTLYVPKNKTC